MFKTKYMEQNLELVSDMPNYNKWIFNKIQPYLGETILEIGCGIGNITQFLIKKSQVIAIDSNGRYLKKIKKKFRTYNNIVPLKIDITNKDHIKQLKNYNIDTILCLNVLEHIKYDQTCLENMYQILKQDGKIVLICPNNKRLFGSIDKANLHYRRYSKKDLKNKINKAGFVIIKSLYINLFGIFGWIFHGRILKKKVHIKSHFKFFNIISPILMKLENIIKPYTGLSILIVGTKRGDSASKEI